MYKKLGHISQRASNYLRAFEVHWTIACFWFILEWFIEIFYMVISVQNLREISSANLSGFKWQKFLSFSSLMVTEIPFEVSFLFILE